MAVEDNENEGEISDQPKLILIVFENLKELFGSNFSVF
jgi:hypothetical protein